MEHPYFKIVGKCRNCGRPLVHGETRPFLHRSEDFADNKPIDCWTPEPEEPEHHHHFAQEATEDHDAPPVWSCDICGFKPDPEQDAVAKALAEEDGWIGENVRNTFAWEQHLQRAQRVIAVVKPTGVPAEVRAERARQDAKWGEQNHPNGTGPNRRLFDLSYYDTTSFDYEDLAQWAKERTDEHAAAGTCTFADILLEEVFEALAEQDPVKLRAELVQTAAVAEQWIEKIDRDTARRSTDPT